MAVTVTDYRPTLCGTLGNLQLQCIKSPAHWARPAQGRRRQRIEVELPRCPRHQKFNSRSHQDQTEKSSNSFPCVTVSSWCLHSEAWQIFSCWQFRKAGHSTGLWLQGPRGYTYLGARTGAHTARPPTAPQQQTLEEPFSSWTASAGTELSSAAETLSDVLAPISCLGFTCSK